MLSSGARKAMKDLLIPLAAAWITTDANTTSAGKRAPGLAEDQAGWLGEKALAVPV